MRLFFSIIAIAAIAAAAAIATPTGAADIDGKSPVGRFMALSRVHERDCRHPEDDGRCGLSAAQEALRLLEEAAVTFGCRSASGRPRVRLLPPFERFTEHDAGPVVMAEGSDLRCVRDPRAELVLVDRDALAESCSRVGWQCDIVWIPDYDPTIVFIGRLRERG